MNYIWFNFINPIKQFSCTTLCSISMKSQKTSIESIMKIILPFASNFHTIMVIGITMPICNIAFIAGLFDIIC